MEMNSERANESESSAQVSAPIAKHIEQGWRLHNVRSESCCRFPSHTPPGLYLCSHLDLIRSWLLNLDEIVFANLFRGSNSLERFRRTSRNKLEELRLKLFASKGNAKTVSEIYEAAMTASGSRDFKNMTEAILQQFIKDISNVTEEVLLNGVGAALIRVHFCKDDAAIPQSVIHFLQKVIDTDNSDEDLWKEVCQMVADSARSNEWTNWKMRSNVGVLEENANSKMPSLSTHETPDEALVIISDCLKGHHDAYVQEKVLHRKISVENMLYERAPDGRIDKGRLGDFSLAKIVSDGAFQWPDRTGPPVFMSINVVKGGRHRYRDDMESFFYSRLWIAGCSGPFDPSTGQRKMEAPEDSQFKFWECDQLSTHVLYKGSHMSLEGFSMLLSVIKRGEYKDWIPSLKKHRRLLFDDHGHPKEVDDEALYQGAIKIDMADVQRYREQTLKQGSSGSA